MDKNYHEVMKEVAASQAYAMMSDTRQLQLHHMVYACMNPHGWGGVDERINRDAALDARIRACEEDGVVCVIESGRDCDGVEYDGRVRTIAATRKAYWRLHEEIGNSADGPFYLHVMAPSEARNVRSWSRDRGMEAFEDGHSHVIYSSM